MWLVQAEPVLGERAEVVGCHLSVELLFCLAWASVKCSVWMLLCATRGGCGQVFMALTPLCSRGCPKPFIIPGHHQTCKGLAGLV